MVHCGSPTAIVPVTNPTTNKTWMDRNLGASQVATSSTDVNSYGDLYQWGRFGDGHQCRNSTPTSATSSIDNPTNNNFILASNWRNPANDNLWQGINGINNPCPIAYRLPTNAELDAERLSWSSNNSLGAISSQLRLPLPGDRYRSNGLLYNVGGGGFYWSSTITGSGSIYLVFNNTATMGGNERGFGYSVRCIKD